MNDWIKNEYFRLRRAGWTADRALWGAKVHDMWTDLNPHFVKLELEPEIDFYDDSYIDTWDDISEKQKERLKKEIAERIEREGHWILVGYYRVRLGDKWEPVESIGGFIGDDWRGHGEDTSVMEVTLEAREKAIEDEAKQLQERITYATKIEEVKHEGIQL